MSDAFEEALSEETMLSKLRVVPVAKMDKMERSERFPPSF